MLPAMRKLIVVALCLFPLAAGAQNLRGQWDVETINHQATVTILIDAAGRVTCDVTDKNIFMGSYIGYVARQTPTETEIHLANKTFVNRLHCIIQSSDLLHCYVYAVAEKYRTPGLIMRRVGPGPQTLTSSLR